MVIFNSYVKLPEGIMGFLMGLNGAIGESNMAF
jgi:hypothetical protein